MCLFRVDWGKAAGLRCLAVCYSMEISMTIMNTKNIWPSTPSLTRSTFLITARVRSTREGTVFTGVCLFTFRGGGGVPTFQVGGVPTFPGLDGGVPTFRGGGYLLSGWEWVPTFRGGGTYLHFQCVLAMRRVVCLLHSRRRTVLFSSILMCVFFVVKCFPFPLTVTARKGHGLPRGEQAYPNTVQ